MEMSDGKISSLRSRGPQLNTSQKSDSEPKAAKNSQPPIVQDQFDVQSKNGSLDPMLQNGHINYAAPPGSGGKIRGQIKLSKSQEEAKAQLEQSKGWEKLSDKQRSQITKGLSKLNGEKLNKYVSSTQEKFKSIDTISGHPEYKNISPAQQQLITNQLLKSASLDQTTKNLQGTLDFAGNQIKNKANPDELSLTLNNLLKLEQKNPKAYEKMTSHLSEANKHIDSSANKEQAAKDIRDMLNVSISRAVGDAHNRKSEEVKTEVFNRFFRQYQKDPSDFPKVIEALKNTPGTLQLNWSKKDMVGMNIRGGSPVSDATFDQVFNEKNIPADQRSTYKNSLKVLMQNEGKPDAINTYDSGIVSVGLKQWTSHAGSVMKPLKEFQQKYPEKFQQLLPGFNITQLNGKEALTYNGKSLTITDKKNENSSKLIDNLKQSELIEITQKLGNLGKDPDFQAIQLKGAVDTITAIKNTSVGSSKISEYLKSERGLGHVVDFEANRPAYVKPSFNEAVQNTGKKLGLSSATPSRQELLDGLKAKLNDAEYAKEIDKKYGKGTSEKLKMNAGAREEFLERRLSEEFRDSFLVRVRKEKGGVKHAVKLTRRFSKTDGYYDAAERSVAKALQNKNPTSPANLQIQSGKSIQIR
jgi:hypothetical protein